MIKKNERYIATQLKLYLSWKLILNYSKQKLLISIGITFFCITNFCLMIVKNKNKHCLHIFIDLML